MQLPTQLLRKVPDASKRDFGHVFVLAGSASMLGAAALSAKSALRSGAGLVSVGVARSQNLALQKKLANEIMTKPLKETGEGTLSSSSFSDIKKFLAKSDSLALGPGLSRNSLTQTLIRKIIKNIDLPMVVDADGLNALAGNLNLLKVRRGLKRQAKILTPHPGEMARLLGISISSVQKRRKEIARDFAKKYNCILVLKGNRTVVADGKGSVYINKTGNSGMATAGSGDVLTGIIAAFLGQGVDGFKAARFGVYLHGLAGDLAAKKKNKMSLIASDIIDYIPKALNICS